MPLASRLGAEGERRTAQPDPRRHDDVRALYRKPHWQVEGPTSTRCTCSSTSTRGKDTLVDPRRAHQFSVDQRAMAADVAELTRSPSAEGREPGPCKYPTARGARDRAEAARAAPLATTRHGTNDLLEHVIRTNERQGVRADTPSTRRWCGRGAKGAGPESVGARATSGRPRGAAGWQEWRTSPPRGARACREGATSGADAVEQRREIARAGIAPPAPERDADQHEHPLSATTLTHEGQGRAPRAMRTPISWVRRPTSGW